MIRERVGIMTFALAITLIISNTIVSTAKTNYPVDAEAEKEMETAVEYNVKIPYNMMDTEKTTVEVIKKETELVSEANEDDAEYSDEDLFYLAVAVCREAGGESEEIQLLVANVIINRVSSSVYPDTIYEVLTQRKQYGTMWRDGISFPSWATEKVQEQCYSVAQRILEGERVCPENVLFQAEFEQGSGIYKYCDGYYFCYY